MPVRNEFLLYQTEDGETRIEVRLQGETVWMTQAAMADLYQTTPQNSTTRLKAIYGEGKGKLLPGDLDKDDSFGLKWKHNVHWARLKLVNDGILIKNSPRGYLFKIFLVALPKRPGNYRLK